MADDTRRVTGSTDELIRFLYVERRHSDREIAEALGWGREEAARIAVLRRRRAMGVTPADRPSAIEAIG